MSIQIHGPMYQFECSNCGFVSDVFNTKSAAQSSAKGHDCLWHNAVFRLNYDGEEDGDVYVTHMPTYKQYKLVPVE